jgi:hypothetical protein
MKKLAVRMMIALVVCALTGSMALAKVKITSSTVTFGTDFVVGETLVKKGTYKLVFNNKTNELTVLDKDKAVIAKTIARVEDRKHATSGMEVILARKGEHQALFSLAFPGESRNIVVDGSGTQTAATQK